MLVIAPKVEQDVRESITSSQGSSRLCMKLVTDFTVDESTDVESTSIPYKTFSVVEPAAAAATAPRDNNNNNVVKTEQPPECPGVLVIAQKWNKMCESPPLHKMEVVKSTLMKAIKDKKWKE